MTEIKSEVFLLSSLAACDEGSSYAKTVYFVLGEGGELVIKKSKTQTDVSPGLHSTSDGFDSPSSAKTLGAVSVNGDMFSIGLGLPTGDSRQNPNYQTSPQIVALAQAAMVEAGLSGKEVNLATGVPVERYYDSNGGPDKALIKKKSDLFTTAKILNAPGPEGPLTSVDKELLVSVRSNRVFPEAIGAYFDMLITTNGQRNDNFHPEGDTLIIDMGSNTCDVALIAKDSRIISRYNKSWRNQGFYKVFDLLRPALSSFLARMGLDIDLTQVPISRLEQCLLTGNLRLSSGEHDVQEVVDTVVRKHVNELVAYIKTHLHDKIHSLDKVVLVGAGAETMKPYFKEFMDVSVPEDPAFSNAVGYLKMLAYSPSRDPESGAPLYTVKRDLVKKAKAKAEA
jgi:plasmid segregation protein ParM